MAQYQQTGWAIVKDGKVLLAEVPQTKEGILAKWLRGEGLKGISGATAMNLWSMWERYKNGCELKKVRVEVIDA